jgi:hypothetical protein
MSDVVHGVWLRCESESERDVLLAEVAPHAEQAMVLAIKVGRVRVGLYGTQEALLRVRAAPIFAWGRAS